MRGAVPSARSPGVRFGLTVLPGLLLAVPLFTVPRLVDAGLVLPLAFAEIVDSTPAYLIVALAAVMYTARHLDWRRVARPDEGDAPAPTA